MFSYIELIREGKVNNLSMEDFNRALSFNEMRVLETINGDRLKNNYGPGKVRYNNMWSYGIVYDKDTNKPVCSSGLQKTSKNTARLLTRYYCYKDYRPTNPFLDDIDDYLSLYIQMTYSKDFPILYVSRDRGDKYFKRLSKYREVYRGFKFYPGRIELMFKDNYQNIFYKSDLIDAEEIIKKELTYG